MNFENVFFNQYGRVRSGWRFAAFLFSFYLTGFLIIFAFLLILKGFPDVSSQTGLLAFVVPSAILSALAVFFGWFYGKIFEDLPFRALGCWFTPNWLKDLILGLIIGAFSISVAVLISSLFGGLRFEVNGSPDTMSILLTSGLTLVIFSVVAFGEEVLFRGYLLQTMSRAKLFWLGALLTSLLFASAHNNNPNATVFSWFNTFIAGFWLAIAYWKTRNIWFPFGIHLAWNWVQGAFFGINVSGLSKLATAPLLKVSEQGNLFISGGDYGIEGGIACTVALVVSTLLICFLPVLNPSEEMLAFSGEEIPKGESTSPNIRIFRFWKY